MSNQKGESSEKKDSFQVSDEPVEDIGEWVSAEIARGHSPFVFIGKGKPVSILVLRPEDGISFAMRVTGFDQKGAE